MGGQVNDELDKNVKYLVASDSGQDEYKVGFLLQHEKSLWILVDVKTPP
jgi:hypothetical protein